MANILIIGGGFAGLVAAERLARDADGSDQITLVSPQTAFTFYPALVNYALGDLTREDFQFDLGEKLAEIGVRFVRAESVQIDSARRSVMHTSNEIDGDLPFDYLLVAAGRRLATERVPGFSGHSHHLLGVNAAHRFGEAVKNFESGQIVLGLCPGSRLPVPICEAAFALARKFKDRIDEGIVRIKVIFPDSLEAAFGGARLHNELESAFRDHKIDVLYDIPITEVTSHEVISAEKHRIKHDLLMLVPPFRGNALARDLDAADDDDFVKVDGHMRVNGQWGIYAAGDMVAFSGPKFAHMAVRQAVVAADNILAELAGRPPDKEYYHEIKTVIDAGGPDSIYLHYGVWDDEQHRVRRGRFWGWAKELHDRAWQAAHR